MILRHKLELPENKWASQHGDYDAVQIRKIEHALPSRTLCVKKY
jgi:hypothetical protein